MTRPSIFCCLWLTSFRDGRLPRKHVIFGYLRPHDHHRATTQTQRVDKARLLIGSVASIQVQRCEVAEVMLDPMIYYQKQRKLNISCKLADIGGPANFNTPSRPKDAPRFVS